MMRGDDMKFQAICKVCLQGVELLYRKERIQRSREQVAQWSELGNRLVPKIERVQHEFTHETFEFKEAEVA